MRLSTTTQKPDATLSPWAERLRQRVNVPLLVRWQAPALIGRELDVLAAVVLGGTSGIGQAIAVTLAAVAQGVQVHRVHDAVETRQALNLWSAVTTGKTKA